jgi:hypothetical protein
MLGPNPYLHNEIYNKVVRYLLISNFNGYEVHVLIRKKVYVEKEHLPDV